MASTPSSEPRGHGPTEQESTRIDTGDQVGTGRDLGELVGNRCQPARIGEHRGQVLELDSRRREVGDLPGQCIDQVGCRHRSRTQRSMFQPAPQRLGLVPTAYIFFDASKVRCWR